jgi:hypothetical protein
MTEIYTESQNFTRDSETWYVNVLAIPVGGGNVTSALCRYKYYGYYNERIPFMKEGGCI